MPRGSEYAMCFLFTILKHSIDWRTHMQQKIFELIRAFHFASAYIETSNDNVGCKDPAHRQVWNIFTFDFWVKKTTGPHGLVRLLFYWPTANFDRICPAIRR